MSPYIILAVVLTVTAAAGGGYAKGRHDESMVQVEQQRDGLLAYAERIKQGEVQHDADQDRINRLTADLGRVRVHIPACPTSTDQSGVAGVFSDRVDEEFGRLQARAGELFQRCDQLNIDAIRLNSAIGK